MVDRSAAPSALDLTFAALADPTRREILRRLQHMEEARVTDLARPLPMSLAAVSKHIGVLERAGLVRRDVRGRDHFLRAAPGRLAEAEAWIAAYARAAGEFASRRGQETRPSGPSDGTAEEAADEGRGDGPGGVTAEGKGRG
ncbi:ArsR/SmtB family transcription factor [Streptomyces sp. NBC_01190]|uniref:ArsR/SmtB family transcription factor n=1 Tax=Streptomyces sp. NBC_01190 TaxID=2903767 RepID=UPI00386B59D6|nr:metalloregulator ArsR/SmtB family transcription factor [Streptomyces sp. NBC_01190]